MSELKEAGYFELKSFLISSFNRTKTFEIKPIIHSFEIHESMKRGSVRGFAKMFDSVGLYQDFPLRGEEYIQIRYEDYYGNEHTDDFFLYAITDVRRTGDTNNPSKWEYTMHFTSIPKVFTEREKIQRAFAGPLGSRESGDLISEFVQTVFDEFYDDDFDKPTQTPFVSNPRKKLVLEETTGKTKLVVPNYSPEQTMHFFARKAYNASSFSQTFHFFENRKEYVFGTNEFVDDYYGREFGIFEYRQDYEPSYKLEDQVLLQQSVINIDYGEVVNSIEDISSGGYKRTLYEVDLLYNIINERDYDHEENFSRNNPDLRLYHTKSFLDKMMLREYDRWVVKDYSTEGMPEGPGIRPNTHYAEIYNKKGAHLYHTNRNKVTCTVYGNNNVIAGSVVYLDILKHTSDDSNPEDEERSGEFLVEAVENIFYEQTYIQKLTLTRNGVGNYDISQVDSGLARAAGLI